MGVQGVYVMRARRGRKHGWYGKRQSGILKHSDLDIREVVGRQRIDRPLELRQVENPAKPANHRLAGSEGIVGKSQSWTKIVPVRLIQRNSGRKDLLSRVIKVRDSNVRFLPNTVVFIAHAVIEGQARSRLSF